MTTIQQTQVGQVFTVPADDDGISYEVRQDGIYAIGQNGDASERIDSSQFDGVELHVVVSQ